MADPTDPNVALPDPAKTAEAKAAIAQLAAALTTAATALKAFGEGAATTSAGVGTLKAQALNAFKGIIDDAGNLKDAMLNIKARMSDGDFFDFLKFDKDNLHKEFIEASKHIKGGTSKLNDILATHRVNLAEAIVFDFAAEKLESSSIFKALKGIEDEVTEPIKSVSEGVVGLGTSIAEGAVDAVAFERDVSNALVGSARSASILGVSTETARSGLNALTDAGIASGEVFSTLNTETRSSGEVIDGLTAAIRISSATGLEMTTIGKYMQQNIRQLGRSVSDTSEIFAALSLAQDNTGLSIDAVSDSVMTTAGRLRYYGTNVESLANTFNAFIQSVGRGRAELGKELFAETLTQIESMNFGMKAFLGMQSGIGQGRGAIGAGLEVEQALAEGRTGELFASIRQQLEQLGGGRVLTRQEALAGGQETQYLMQRQLLETMTGQRESGKLEMMLGILQRGEVERATEVFAGRGEARIGERKEVLLDTGQRRIDLETGVVQQGLNRLRAEEGESIGKLVSAYAESTDMLRSVTTNVLGGLQDEVRSMVAAIPGFMPRDEGGRIFGGKKWEASEEAVERELGEISRSGSGETVQDVTLAPMSFPTRGTTSREPAYQTPLATDIVYDPQLTPPTSGGLGSEPPIFGGLLDVDRGLWHGIQDTLKMNMPPKPPVNSQSAAPATDGTQPAVQPLTVPAPTALRITIPEVVEFPVSLKVDGESIRISFSAIEQRITANVISAVT